VQERISNLERGTYGLPSLPALTLLADALDVGLADLLQVIGLGDGLPGIEESVLAPPVLSLSVFAARIAGISAEIQEAGSELQEATRRTLEVLADAQVLITQLTNDNLSPHAPNAKVDHIAVQDAS
jgi:hypothetical protein